MSQLDWSIRDVRTIGGLKRAFKKVPRREIFAQTGLQFMELNSLYQLLAWQEKSLSILEAAATLLFMPDFLHWAMCGSKRAEFTIASTSQCVHPLKRNWSLPTLKKLGLPTHLLPKICPPGKPLGPFRKSLAVRTGLVGVKVVAPPSHDTASAIAGVPTANIASNSKPKLDSIKVMNKKTKPNSPTVANAVHHGLVRREFIKRTGLATGLLAWQPWRALAGPFDVADFAGRDGNWHCAPQAVRFASPTVSSWALLSAWHLMSFFIARTIRVVG